MSTEVRRAIVHYANATTGTVRVKIPGVTGEKAVPVNPQGLVQNYDGTWNTPSPGDLVMVAVEGYSDVYWVSGYPSSDAALSNVSHPQWDDLRVPLSTINTGAPNAPTYLKWRDDGAGSVGVYGYSFSATSREDVFFEAQLPHRYKEGSRIAPHCHFTTTSTPTVGQTVRFGLEYTYANGGGVYPVTTTIYAEYTFVTGDAAYQSYIGGFDPDIEDANMKVSAMISCRFYRDAANAADTYTGEVVVNEVDFHFLSESLGSDNEFSK